MSNGSEADALERGEWRSLHPKVMVRWRLEAAVVGAMATAVVGAAHMLLSSADLFTFGPTFALPASILVVTLFVVIVWPPLVYRRWSYRLGEDALELRHGVVIHRQSAVPYRRVQQVDLSRGPIDRLLTLSNADLTTAAATTNGSIPGLAPHVAEEFRRLVLERAGRDDAV